MPTDIKNISIILFGLMGDIIMRTPVIKILKDFYPNAKITVFVDAIGKEVFKNDPSIENIIIVNRKKDNRIRYIKEKIKAQIELLRLRPDLVMDLYGGSSAKNMLKLNFAKYKIGFDDWKVYTNKALKIDKMIKSEEFKNPYHLTNKVFPILSFLPIEIEKLSTKPIVYTNSAIDKKIQRFRNSLNSKVYLLSLGSGGVEKLLDMDKNIKLVKYIYEKYGYKPALILNPGQEYLQKDFITLLKRERVEYIKLPLFSIEELASLMKYMDFFIVPDTGLFHLAVGVGIPLFTVFTYTNPKLVEPDSGIYGFCYEEIDKKDNFGLNLCTKDIDISKLKRCFDDFIKSLSI